MKGAARESERGPVGKLHNKPLRMRYILWFVNFDSFCQHSCVTDADEKCDSVDWPTRLLRRVTFVNLPFSFLSLNLSLLRTCLWRALYAALFGPGSLIILYVFFSLEAVVNWLREIMLWFSSLLMSFSWVAVNLNRLHGRSIWYL